MIRVIYNKPQLYNKWRILWVSILFLSINYLVFISFMNVCFQTLATNQPIALLTIALLLVSADIVVKMLMTKKALTIGNVVDAIVVFCLVISFSLFHLFKRLVFIQVVALLKLHDTAYFNVLVYNLVKKYGFIFKTYVVLKISYWVIMVGHILGCIFYTLDLYLINIEYFGTIAESPNSYYQGSLKVYTSIYTLSQIQRYVYAIYYSFSLLSTVAFGDIIGHNYLEDILVAVYLIIATIGIALIIQQMYIVFRRQKTMYYLLVSKLKYVSQYIKTQPNITQQFRHDLINYMINSQWKQITTTPNLKQLTLKLEKSLFSQSILSKTEDPLPLIIKTNFLPLLKSKYFPANYFVIDYNRLQNHIDGRIILNAKIKIGYTKELIGKQYLEAQCINYGFNEVIVGTNSLAKYFTVQLSEQAQVFVITDDDFNLKMLQFKNYVNQFLPTPVEFYQISKDKVLSEYKQKQYCASCKAKGHTLINCQKFHYTPRNLPIISLYRRHYNQQRQPSKRRNFKSKKNTSMKSFAQMKQQKQGKPNLEIHFSIIQKIFTQNNIFQNLFEKTIGNYTQQSSNSSSTDLIDSYYAWKIYCPDGRL